MPTIVRCPTCKPNVSWNPLIKKWRKQDYLSDKSFFGHSVLRFYPQLIQPPYYPCRTVTPSSCHLCLSLQFSWVRLFFFFSFFPLHLLAVFRRHCFSWWNLDPTCFCRRSIVLLWRFTSQPKQSSLLFCLHNSPLITQCFDTTPILTIPTNVDQLLHNKDWRECIQHTWSFLLSSVSCFPHILVFFLLPFSFPSTIVTLT